MLYWLPAIAMVAVGPLAISNGWRAIVWTVALAIMGTACIVNALRCGRHALFEMREATALIVQWPPILPRCSPSLRHTDSANEC
jgi:hypothetical protein